MCHKIVEMLGAVIHKTISCLHSNFKLNETIVCLTCTI